MFWDAVSMMLERTCSGWIVQKLLPLPPLNLAADAVLGYFSVMDARESAAETARLNQPSAPPLPPTGSAPVCEMLPFPKQVSGSAHCAPQSGCVPGCGDWSPKAGPTPTACAPNPAPPAGSGTFA